MILKQETIIKYGGYISGLYIPYIYIYMQYMFAGTFRWDLN